MYLQCWRMGAIHLDWITMKKQEVSFSFYKINDAINSNQKYWEPTGSNMILRELKVFLLMKNLTLKIK